LIGEADISRYRPLRPGAVDSCQVQ
jgi:hypothetical protein